MLGFAIKWNRAHLSASLALLGSIPKYCLGLSSASDARARGYPQLIARGHSIDQTSQLKMEHENMKTGSGLYLFDFDGGEHSFTLIRTTIFIAFSHPHSKSCL